MTKSLTNHPGMWLRDDAADAINALEAKYGPIVINSAGRSVADQQKLIDAYDAGDPNVYMPMRPPEASTHVQGIAVDVYNYTDDRAKLIEFGYEWFGPDDKVHYTFVGGGSSAVADQNVANEQSFLNAARGENLAVDGIQGSATTAAFKRYQQFLRSYGYTGDIDGIWGGGTQTAHAKYYAEWDAQRNASKSTKSAGELSYADIQTALNRHGYNLAVDNVWGPKSSAALADFQAKNGLVVDRIIGPATWAKLNG